MGIPKTSGILGTFAIILLSVVLTSGCTQGGVPAAGGNKDKLQVYVSFFTLGEFAAAVGGERVAVYNMVPGGTEAHHWEPSPRDLTAPENADLFIYNGFGMEPWLDKVRLSVSGPKFYFAGKGIEVKHGRDPHVWLDPLQAKKMVMNIARALAETDGAHAAIYRENSRLLLERLDVLDREYEAFFRPLPGVRLVVSHGAFGHLADRYHFRQVSILGTNADETPNPARMVRLIDLCREAGINTIYYARGESSRLAETLAREINGRVLDLDPIERRLDSDGDYFARMRYNLAQLRKGLGE